MLVVMDLEQFNPLPGPGRAETGRGRTPGHPEDRAAGLRTLLAAEEFFIATATELAKTLSSPTEAAALALIVERTHRRTAYVQVLAAQGTQRTLANELPITAMEELTAVIGVPDTFISGATGLPEDPATPPTGRLPHKDNANFLQHLLGIAFFEARERTNAGTALLAHTDPNGITRPARYPRLSSDAQSGAIDPRHAIAIAKKLDKVAPLIKMRPDAEQLSTTLQEQVSDSLRTQGSHATGTLITAWQHSLEDSAPSEPTEEEIRAKTGIVLTRRTEHFSWYSLCMLNAEAEIFLSHFANADNARTAAGNRDKLAHDAAVRNRGGAGNDADTAEGAEAPRLPAWAADPNTPVNELPRAAYTDLGTVAGISNGTGNVPATSRQAIVPPPEGLTPARRHLQSILNALRAVGTGSAKDVASATLVVHCQLETLLGLAERAGITAHGLDIGPGTLRRMLCDAGVLPIVFNGESQILDLGREQRFVPEYMRAGILARDGGCLVPGCTVPPEHCEMCHIDSWEDGGGTGTDNTGPGCSQHHHDFHSGKIRLVRDANGLPAVLLPKYLDPEQLPRRNEYWQHKRQTNPKLF